MAGREERERERERVGVRLGWEGWAASDKGGGLGMLQFEMVLRDCSFFVVSPQVAKG